RSPVRGTTYLPAVVDDRGFDRAEVINRDGAFVPDPSAPGCRFVALADRAVNAGLGGRPRLDEVEVRRPPGFEAPAKDPLVESAGAPYVVGFEVQMRHVVGQGG